MFVKAFSGLRPNKIIKHLILADLAFWTGWGLINPIFAIFIEKRIVGATPLVVGLASAAFWFSRSLFRVPIGLLVDSLPGEKDDYFFLVVGLFLAALVPFGFIFAQYPWHIYLLQAMHGLALAMAFAGWVAIFTRHIDKGKESTEWGFDATAIGLGTGLAGAVGGWAVTRFGFNLVFITVGLLGLLSACLLFALNKQLKGALDKAASKKPKKKALLLLKNHKPQS